MDRKQITPFSQIQARALIRTIPSFSTRMAQNGFRTRMAQHDQRNFNEDRPPATLSKGFIDLLMTRSAPKKPALVTVLSIREMDNFSFRLRLYDGKSKCSSFSTARSLYDQLLSKANDTPFVMRLDEVLYSDQTVRGQTMLVFFIKRAAVLSAKPPPEAYEILSQLPGATAPEPSLPDSLVIPMSGLPTGRIQQMELPIQENQPPQGRVLPQSPVVEQRKRSGHGGTPTSVKRVHTVPPGAQTTPTKLPANVTSIAFVTPMVKGYRVCGIAYDKTNMSHITDAKGGHKKVFSFILHDHRHDEIKISAFDEIAEHYYHRICNGEMYYITSSSARSVSATKPEFNKTNTEFEITLKDLNLVQPCMDAYPIDIPPLHLNRTFLKEIRNHLGKFVDILAFVTDVSEISMVTIQRTGRETQKREVTLVDDSNVSARLTLWGREAEQFDALCTGCPIAIKEVSVKEYLGNYSLQAGGKTKMRVQPNDAATDALRAWFNNRADNEPIECISESSDLKSSLFARDLRSVAMMSNMSWETLAEDPRGVYFNVVASVVYLRRESMYYKACPNTDCLKKVVEDTERYGSYKCPKCGTTSASFKYVTHLSAQIADWSGAQFVSMFGDNANQLLGLSSSDEFGIMDQDTINAMVDKIMFRPFSFRLRMKADKFNDNNTVSWQAYNVSSVPYSGYIKALGESLRKISSEEAHTAITE